MIRNIFLINSQDAGSGVQEADNALLVKQALHLLEDAMEGIKLPSGSSQPGVTRAGEFVYALFEHAGITFDTAAVSLGTNLRGSSRITS